MNVEIVNDNIVISIENPGEGGWIIDIIDRSSNNRKISSFFKRTAEGNLLNICTSVKNFNALTHKIEIRNCRGSINFEDIFEKYRLDLNQIDNHAYMTKNLFGAGLRKLSNSDMFYMAYCHLNILPKDNQFYGGLITLLSFRIAEDIDRRSSIIDDLLIAYDEMMKIHPLNPNHSIRWRISSAVNLAILLCYLDREDDAGRIIEQAVSHPYYNGIFPLTHMNYANLLSLSGMFAVKNGSEEIAYMRFSECANYCNYAVSDLFSLRNNYYFQHEHDVRTLIDVGYQSAIAVALLSRDRHPGDSKMTFNRQAAPRKNLTFNPIFSRFISILKNKPPISQKTISLLNDFNA